MKVCHFRDDFSNAFVTKRQTDRLRREAFGVRRIPALCESSARLEAKAPEYGALQTLRALVCQSAFSLQRHSKNRRENGKLLHICIQRAGLRFEVYGGALRTDAPYLRYVLALFVM